MLLRDLVIDGVTVPEGAGGIDVTGITADSRAVGRGFLFAALAGVTTDGSRYVEAAVAAGAAAVLADPHAMVVAPPGVAVLRAAEPRQALARLAARFYPRQPENLVAVTGTAGKTSVASFYREICTSAGREAASMGTVGVASRRWSAYGSLTTPDPVSLHAALDRLAGEGVTHAAIEASSHGLDQRRLDGIRIRAAAFTNLGRDHMDYHPDVGHYLAAKLRLFTAILPEDGVAVVDMDGARSEDVAAAAAGRGIALWRVGRKGAEIRILDVTAAGFEQVLDIEAFGQRRTVRLPLAGSFQASNALVAAGLAIATGIEADRAFAALATLKGAPGRLELVGEHNGALVYVDYAHKPDALASVLQALAPLSSAGGSSSSSARRRPRSPASAR
jgi:UDP-N-acetylmuramoyl-L-alanyl-D-glutamate--2,6-diaminopimelate ligase